MIQSNELRKGNNVCDVSGVVLKVVGIRGEIIWCNDGRDEVAYSLGELRYFTLSDEVIRLNLGFQQYKTMFQKEIAIHKFEDGTYNTWTGIKWLKLTSVHHLQNVFYFFVGEELTFKN